MAEWMLAVALEGLPSSRREWGEAMLAEAAGVDDAAERARWLRGAAYVAWRWRLSRAAPRLGLPSAAVVTLVVLLDRSPSDVANQVTLLALVLGAGVVAFGNPHAARLVAIFTGLSVSVAHTVYLLAGLQLPYESQPGGWVGPLALLLLLAPAGVAAAAGARIRLAVARRES